MAVRVATFATLGALAGSGIAAASGLSGVVVLLLPAIGAAAGAAWWGIREATILRGAMQVASRALAGRAVTSTREAQGGESVMLAEAVRVLVDRAEHSTRELSQRQAFAAVGDFATELARELAPSVATARSAIRAIETNIHLDSPLRPPLERAQRELHRLSNTLQDTLRLARSGKMASQRIDLWIPLRAALKTATGDATSYGIRIDAPPPGKAPVWVHGDAEALEQLFLNLLTNAVQATEAAGRIDVDVSVDMEATVSIKDNGVGIPDGALDRVFEPFYSTRPEKAGLGLAIAWRTAAAHGGRLAIQSAQGRGTSVDVSLPLADAASSYRLQ
jgi:signal transduction histidine kinase